MITQRLLQLARDARLVLTLKCEHSHRLQVEREGRRLRRAEALALTLHMAICKGCRRAQRHLRLMREAFERERAGETADLATDAPALSEDARERLRAAVRHR